MNIFPFKHLALFCCVATLALAVSAQEIDSHRHTGLANTVSVAILRTPIKARQHFEKARQAAIAGRDAEYAEELSAALTIDPNFGEAYVLRASREIIRQQFDAAIADALTAQRFEPGIAWATIVHAEACNSLRRYDEAFALLDSLRPAELATWEAKYEMTRAAVGRRDSDAALQWSKLTLEAVPESGKGNALLLRANALQLAHRFSEAVAQFDTYLALPLPQLMRSKVLLVRDNVLKQAHEENFAAVASQ